ncbi:S-layer homology domain-containing protein [Brevibacillus sp. AY1]|uniref:S-layer homology domain-containing protein n=1 Tax=Brevibacillus sp. AY1 TaxID=2807621 RepID=UPI002458ECD4|nr:S-layer homology domain-containing protein [Brevibacillus sp. AY1]MDH4618910.1 S-layer homology domain-containing protein [Brevibacillus sp. AY1]
MNIRKKSWMITAGVASAILLVPAFSTPGHPFAVTSTVHAAVQQTKELSKEEAIQRVQKLISIPSQFKLERANFQGAERYPFLSQSTWNLSWSGERDAGIYVTIDAITGKLLQYSRYGDESVPSVKKVSEAVALEAAKKFLEDVTSDQEREKLSDANEYGIGLSYSTGFVHHPYYFVRIENDIPFLENGFRVVVDEKGEVVQFSRNWYEDTLPDSKPALSLEEAEEKMSEAAPSLVYKSISSITGNYLDDRYQYQLVYQYNRTDPQFVDAMSGDMINAQGTEAQPVKIQPLGTTISQKQEKLITKEEAQIIADQIAKRLSGSYRSEGSRGGGSSSGPDGVERRRWNFEYSPLQGDAKEQNAFEISIGDRGELVGYEFSERTRRIGGAKIEQPVSWEQAEKNALQLVKALYSDSLGEIYYQPQKPTEAFIKDQLEKGQPYSLSFGWLKNGVPVEDSYFYVDVSAATGVVEYIRTDNYENEKIQSATNDIVEVEQAKQAEQDQKKMMLTYYQPDPYISYRLEQKQQPILVYRYVGDAGVVDAVSGEWISYAEQSKSQGPQDIGDHPQKEALELAIRYGFMTVTDGKLEPDKELTRGEAAQIMARALDRVEFRSRSYFGFSDEPVQMFSFSDVDAKHPLFGVIQKNLQHGVIAKEGQRFEPDKLITRAQLADMAARMLGYGDLLNKPEIFVPSYSDLQKNQIPAVTLLHAEGIVIPGSSAGKFDPEGSVTKAEIAQLLKALLDLQKQKQ